MFGIGWPEMALILAVALIFIGPKKLPDLAKSLGRALGEFKKVTDDFKESISMDSTLNEVKDEFKDLGKKVKDPLEKKTNADTNTSEDEPSSETDEGESDNTAAEAEEATPPDAASDSDSDVTSDSDSDAASDSDSEEERAQSFLSDVYAPPSQEETDQTATETENTEASDNASEPENTPADPTDSEDAPAASSDSEHTPSAPAAPDEISPDVPTEGQLKDA